MRIKMIKSTLEDQIKITAENIESINMRLKEAENRLQLLYEQQVYRDFKIRNGSIVRKGKDQYLVTKIHFYKYGSVSSILNSKKPSLTGLKFKKNGEPSKVNVWIGQHWDEIEKS